MNKSEKKLLEKILEKEKLSLTQLAEETGYSKSWVWKNLAKLEKKGLIRTHRIGRTLIIEAPEKTDWRKILIIGILRASEYPYIIPLRKKLTQITQTVHVKIYDDPYKTAMDLSLGKIHLAMAPAPTLILAHRLSGGNVNIIGGGSGGGAGIAENPQAKNKGHATTMASSMEYCAVRHKLEPPRIYARSGDELLSLVSLGKVGKAVLWEPYLSLARLRGLRTEKCELPVCCLLGANIELWDVYDRITVFMAESVSEARRRLDDPVLVDAFSNLVGLGRELVERSLPSYTFYEEPPKDVIMREWRLIKETLLPEDILDQAVRV